MFPGDMGHAATHIIPPHRGGSAWERFRFFVDQGLCFLNTADGVSYVRRVGSWVRAAACPVERSRLRLKLRACDPHICGDSGMFWGA